MKKSRRTNMVSIVKKQKEQNRALKAAPSDFKHITGDQVKFLATKANCTEDYIRKVLNAQRPAKTAMAKKVVIAARFLNRTIANAQTKVSENILVDND